MPKKVDREQKRRQITMAAIAIFAEKGVKNTRIIDIAQKAGVGKGTIYEYFRSQDEILYSCFIMVMENSENIALEILSEPLDPESKLRKIFDKTWEALSSFPADFLTIFLDFWSEGLRQMDNEAGLYYYYKSFYHKYREEIAGILQEGIDNGHFRPLDTIAAASVLISIFDGLLLQMMVDRKAFDKNTIINKGLDFFLQGLRINRKDKT
jgi:TetR/AcrR family fatty acid metabolism transcriptional regulator